jgi:hypothetical protein
MNGKMSVLQHSPRRTRQSTRVPQAKDDALRSPADGTAAFPIDLTTPNSSWTQRLSNTASQTDQVEDLPSVLTRAITKLDPADHRTLQKKQSLLRESEVYIPTGLGRHSSAVAATLVFAQEEAGTAVCVSSSGRLLTCSHCVAESAADFDASREHWLLFASGRAVKAVCKAWDPLRDLALLQIVAAQCEQGPGRGGGHAPKPATGFPFVGVAASPPSPGSRLFCVGHPGSEDLEESRPGVKTHYDVLHVSEGAFRGYAPRRRGDLQDNSVIGALKHDCWTYWGHSGAPLLHRSTGEMVGMHSSWDDVTGMRRGIPLEAVEIFLGSYRAY